MRYSINFTQSRKKQGKWVSKVKPESRMPKSLQILSGVNVRWIKKLSKLLLCTEKNKFCFVQINY